MAKLNPFAEALAKLATRGVRPSAMTSAEWADVPVALRERAFFSARVENATYLQDVQERVEKILHPQTVERDGKQVTEGMNLATARAPLSGRSPEPSVRIKTPWPGVSIQQTSLIRPRSPKIDLDAYTSCPHQRERRLLPTPRRPGRHLAPHLPLPRVIR